MTSNGGRAKAYAEGTAYAGGGGALWNVTTDSGSGKTKTKKSGSTKTSLTNATKNTKNAFEELFDWFEVKMEELNEDLDQFAAELENAATVQSKNSLLNSMIQTNKEELKALEKGQKLYSDYAKTLLKQKNKKGNYIIPKKYWDEVKNGKVALEEFYGKVDEKTLKQIKNYREWAQKAADLKKQIQEVKKAVAELAKQKFDNIDENYDNTIDVYDTHRSERVQNHIDLTEESGNIASVRSYNQLIGEELNVQSRLTAERAALQASLNESVKNGDITRGSEEWWDMVKAIQAVDIQLDESIQNVEEYQNAINEIHWDNLDELINRFDYMNEEAQNTIDLMSDKDMFDMPDNENGWGADDVNWTNEGLATIGLYAQKMEIAQAKAKKYGQEIDALSEAYAQGKYSESEYLEKLNELKNKQHDAIQDDKDAQEAIVELNEARVDHIKEGIEREIEAYSELIDKKKEELDAEKDLYDFQKSTMEQQKDIAKLERQLAALSGDNSASAMAKRRQLEAELAEAKAGLEESYYDRSISNQQDALDKELETFQEEKDAEMEALDTYLKDTALVVADSIASVESAGTSVLTALNGLAEEYGVKISDALKKPWEDAETAIANTISNIQAIETDYAQDVAQGDQEAVNKNQEVQATTEEIVAQQKEEPKQKTPASKDKDKDKNKDKDKTKYYKKYTGKSGSIVDALKAIGAKSSFENRKKIAKANGIKNYKGTATQNTKLLNLLKKGKLKKYAVGSMKIDEDQLALLHELGDELVLHAGQNGKLEYLSKGSGVVPADLTSNLMDWGELNPQDILDRNRPSIGAHPEVHATEINIDIKYGDMLRIDNFKGDNPDEIAKIVAKQFEKHTKDLNSALRKYVR